jgi:hypothetical protein
VKHFKFIRLFLILLLIIILFLFFLYIKEKSNVSSSDNSLKNIDKDLINKIETSSSLKKITYVSEDIKGNIYTINSLRGFIEKNNPNIIFMERVVGTIRLSNNEIIKITSDNAKFNNQDYKTDFFGNVTIEFDEHRARADNLDLSFDDKHLIMQNNLIYKNSSISVTSDILEIDFYKKVSKVFMKSKNKNVKIKNIN